MPSAQAETETLVGAPVAALYTGAPPKLVDLDPMQQNGSEIWGLTMMFGGFDGSWVAHPDLVPICREIYKIVQGEITEPHRLRDASGSD